MPFYTHDNTIDSPLNNFAVLNLLTARGCTVSKGNLRYQTSNHDDHDVMSSIAIPTKGIWYFEMAQVAGDLYFAVAPTEWFQANTNDNSMGYIRCALYYGPESYSNTSWANCYIQGNGAGDGSTYYAQSGYEGNTREVHTCCLDFDNQLMTVTRGGYSGGMLQATLNSNIMSYDFVYVGRSVTGGSWPSSSGYFNFGQDQTFNGVKQDGGGYPDANGVGQFYYQPPEGALSLCTANLPEGPIKISEDDVPADYFKTVTWTGSGSSRNIEVGWQPDLVWVKNRNNSNESTWSPSLFDSLRPDGHRLSTDNTNANQDYSTHFGSITSTGFSFPNSLVFNDPNGTYVGWCWKAAGSPAENQARIIDTDGSLITKSTADLRTETGASITPAKVSANRKSGFSIVKMTTSNVEANNMSESFPHGLSQTPEFVISKSLGTNQDWLVYHHQANGGNTPTNLQGVLLNYTGSTFTNSYYKTMEVNSSLVKIGRQAIEHNGTDAIFYCFHSVPGYSKFGSYVGTGSSFNKYVECGFSPAWILIKHVSGSQTSSSYTSWFIVDNKRDTYNPTTNILWANSSVAEGYRGNGSSPLIASVGKVDFVSNGFNIIDEGSDEINDPNDTYLFAAFAEAPFSAPATAR